MSQIHLLITQWLVFFKVFFFFYKIFNALLSELESRWEKFVSYAQYNTDYGNHTLNSNCCAAFSEFAISYKAVPSFFTALLSLGA